MANIIVAEDDKFISHAYRNALELAGHQVHMAGDGDEALQLIAKYKPDLVLLDLVMPGRNGFDTLKEIRVTDQKLPIIILSNLGQDSDIKQCKKYGISAYLIKSDTSMKEVLHNIRKYLPKKKSGQKKLVKGVDDK
ncbi:MAG: hypothetical protein UT42_C0003G0002 [Candidatus Falkowbacteria bacterium GW2011_GWA2_39_24]|uniref:Response regulatory domain-containing protein n=1 Tax=Candidatus Falkowbacteria bacterium GW2011_GWA2_39_24 TaxID=1618634 RepID=A0A0G0QYJ2_9BACT|nr:MAG: hypothetical protein UT42_C0003G0002 [Candidatus Falkowbacteria bacterium GW2011_GWA2_39_24]